MNKKILKDFALLVGIVVVCAIAARIMAGGETLSDYAVKNPEAAGVASTEVLAKSDSSAVQSSTLKAGNDKESAATESGSTAETDKASSEAATTDISSETAIAESTSEAANTASSNQETQSSERVTYMDGFYYEPISNEIFKRISGISYPVDCTIPIDELRYLSLQYVDFNGNTQTGEMICNKALAQDVIEIFYELYANNYQIESIKLVDEFGGDDTASMLANNTSCFNYRVVEGTTKLSNHAYGRAIDLNPFYNPYITYNKDGTTNISPEGSEPYADRSASFPYKIDENDLAYKLFKAHGFRWGGDWNSSKDYQHFDKK